MDYDEKGWLGMKKLFWTMIVALVMLFGATALAEQVVLPDPGYYFGRTYKYDEEYIEFDEYPEAEFDAYTALLTEKYGMEITDSNESGFEKFYFMKKPGVQDSKVFIACCKESNGSYGMEFMFNKGITLSELDVYTSQTKSAVGEIAWDNGRMIADPGDFLGYEIKVLETSEGDSAGGGFIQYRYESIPTTDILALVDAIGESPYFEANGGRQGKYYWFFCFSYTGSDKELTALCTNGRAERRGRDSDLSVYINDPDLPESEFYLYQYPGFTINSESVVSEPSSNPDNGSIWKTCDVCDGDGKCKYCWGRGYHWNDRNQDCSVCRGTGDCYSCGGKGRK